MEIWFSDFSTPNIKLDIRVTRQLFSGMSDIQQVDVFDSVDLGRFISLDGEVVFSEKDEFIYDEMVVHVPMAVHPRVRKVLVIGGGDGGVAKELCAYPEIESIDVVEPDEMFMDVSRKFFPETAAGLDDPRVSIFIQDGLRFLRGRSDEYDLIINDSTDPFGPTEGLFTKEFYGNCYKALRADGVMVYQSPAAQCTARCTSASRSAASTRRTSPPVRRGIGCSGSRPRNTTRSTTSVRTSGTSAASRPGITPPTCTRARSCCRATWKTYSKKRRNDNEQTAGHRLRRSGVRRHT